MKDEESRGLAKEGLEKAMSELTNKNKRTSAKPCSLRGSLFAAGGLLDSFLLASYLYSDRTFSSSFSSTPILESGNPPLSAALRILQAVRGHFCFSKMSTPLRATISQALTRNSSSFSSLMLTASKSERPLFPSLFLIYLIASSGSAKNPNCNASIQL